MSEKEAIEQIESLIDDRNSFIDPTDKSEYNIFRKDKKALQTALQLLEQKDKRIDELEKALVEEDLKHRNKIKELEADLYSANCTINDYIEERNKLKDKMIGDRMEQFDDYVIYLIEKYLEVMGE